MEGGRASGRLSGANGKVKEGIGCWTSGSINGFYRGESRVLRLIYGFLRISFFFFFFSWERNFRFGIYRVNGKLLTTLNPMTRFLRFVYSFYLEYRQ